VGIIRFFGTFVEGNEGKPAVLANVLLAGQARNAAKKNRQPNSAPEFVLNRRQRR
jgi:hypothetical protein